MNNKSEVDRAVSVASGILIFADNTEKKLREKLSKKGFDDGTVSEAIELLREAGLVNDGRLIRNTIEYLASRKLYGRARLKPELAKRGFDRDLIDGVFDEYTSDIDFKGNCLKLVRRKGLESKFLDKETRKNVAGSLARSGYSYPEMKYALGVIIKENTDGNTEE